MNPTPKASRWTPTPRLRSSPSTFRAVASSVMMLVQVSSMRSRAGTAPERSSAGGAPTRDRCRPFRPPQTSQSARGTLSSRTGSAVSGPRCRCSSAPLRPETRPPRASEGEAQ